MRPIEAKSDRNTRERDGKPGTFNWGNKEGGGESKNDFNAGEEKRGVGESMKKISGFEKGKT